MPAKVNKRPALCNAVVFAEVMEDPEICKKLLERILPGKKIRELRFVKAACDSEGHESDGKPIVVKEPETEKVISVGVNAKSVQIDVLFEGEDEWYDIEMQVEDRYDSPKRSRYYHAVKDVKSLQRGQSYNALKPGYVIFICMFDYFKLGAAVYEFQMYDVKKDLKLGDEQVTIFLNGTCKENVPEELKAFYRYLQTGEVSETDSLIVRMDRAAAEAVKREEVRYKMTLYDDALRWKEIIDSQQVEIAANQAELEANKAEIAANQAKLQEANRIRLLTAELARQNRADDILQALEDETYLQKLLEELGL